MELLHVYGPDGAELRTEDLAGRTRSILICRAEGGIVLSETAEPGADVAAALVRNEDGWALTSSDLDHPVVAGPKSAPEIQLVPGLVCSVADHSFRLECDQASAGGMLLWRMNRSKVVADAVVAGRNIVALNAADGKPAVNPALVGEIIFEFFPSADGVDLVTGIGERRQRLAVSAGTLFNVGGFEAMYLPSKDAEAALRSGSPFSWPSRGVRRVLLLGLAVLVGLFTLSALFYREYRALRGELGVPRGAVAVAPQFEVKGLASKSDVLAIFETQFFRAIPELTSPEKTMFTDALIRWGGSVAFTNDARVARAVKFVRDVDEIKSLIRSLRWKELGPVLERVDREMFVLADATDFLDDAKEIRECVYVRTPAAVLDVVEGRLTVGDFERGLDREVEHLKAENRFLTEGVQSRGRARRVQYVAAMTAFIAERDKTLAAGEKLTSSLLLALTDAYCNMRDTLEDDAYAPVVAVSEKRLRAFVEQQVKRVKALPDVVENDTRRALLNPLAELGGQIGFDEQTCKLWRSDAKAACQRLGRRCQQLYQDYRMKGANDRALGAKCLDEIIALGYTESKYYGWALREKERIGRK